MTALRLPRPRRVRPAAILVASIVLVAASQAASLLQAPAVPSVGSGSGAQGAAGDPAAAPPVTVDGPLAPPDAPIAGPRTDLAAIDRSIGAWTTNLFANDRDFLSAANLAHLYEERARLSGDAGDLARAEEAANRSLAIEPRQLDVRALHARLLLATHQFGRALAEAESLDRTAPDQPAILAILGDASLELGDVDRAEALYARIAGLAPSAAVSIRLARIDFLRGDTGGAVDRSAGAFEAARAEGATGPALSFYAYAAGRYRLAQGRPAAATAWFDTALESWPASFAALAGRAQAKAAGGDLDGAIEDYRAAIAIAPQPDSIAGLGDLLTLRGETAAASQQYATVLAIARLQDDAGELYNRRLVLFLVDHGGDVADALARAERELEQRKDVYGYDAHAWALLANGRAVEADAAMARALALGTEDAMLLYHAGEIRRSLGDAAGARDFLERALDMEGALDPLTASRAAAALEALR